MTDNRIWVLGAPDPEMNLIERILRECGEAVVYATVWRDGVWRRVTPAEAYGPDVEIGGGLRGLRATAYMVECAPAVLVGSAFDGIDWSGAAITIDHHRPGDPGYGLPPEKFFKASSIGQVIAVLGQVTNYPEAWQRVAVPRHPHWCGASELHRGVWVARTTGKEGDPGQDRDDTATAVVIPPEYVLAAAADHCLGAAYAGECPGVDPDALMRWRAETRAAFQGRPVEDVLADVAIATMALREAPLVELSAPRVRESCGATSTERRSCVRSAVRDLRGRNVPELPEASVREGVAYLATVTERDGRRKVVLGGHTTLEAVCMFMDQWAPAHGLMDIYGDPARGFAGGYVPESE